jgi:hypothetical protein
VFVFYGTQGSFAGVESLASTDDFTIRQSRYVLQEERVRGGRGDFDAGFASGRVQAKARNRAREGFNRVRPEVIIRYYLVGAREFIRHINVPRRKQATILWRKKE